MLSIYCVGMYRFLPGQHILQTYTCSNETFLITSSNRTVLLLLLLILLLLLLLLLLLRNSCTILVLCLKSEIMDGFLKKTGLGRSNHKTVVIFGLSPHIVGVEFFF